jgi:tetratricopeptide (TPR) repeat protein
VLFRKQKDFEKSIFYLKEALKFNPDNFDANYSLGMTYFSIKEFYKGYLYYLKRKRKTPPLKKQWKGEKCPEGAINVYAEGGFGDQIMFARYLPQLKEYFKNVRFLAPPNISKIFNIKGVEICQEIKTADSDCSLMDLPYYLKTDFDNIPVCSGILNADKEKREEYAAKYFQTDKKKIGLFWQGNSNKARSLKNRSIELKELEMLLKNENFAFYSFQKDDFKNQLLQYRDIADLGKTFKDFSDTLAALANLDYMITIDSVMAHLAGCWGIKTFLLLPYSSEWRWFDDANTTHWYKDIEIFRQDETKLWNRPVEDIYKRLNCKIS